MTETQRAEWHTREQNRFLDGVYKTLPVKLAYPPEHYVHLSTEDPEQVAYTPSDAYGIADRQTRLKFGRYLKKVFPDLSDADIQAHVTAFKSHQAVAANPAKLHFTTDKQTINAIFETPMCACGSTSKSCMHGKFDGDDDRPYHVYANSPDIAVAYVTQAHRAGIIARSVVSTKDQIWIRAYSIESGDNDADCGTLKQLLDEAGFSKGDLFGNRLTKLDTDNVMLPYLDNSGAHVKDRGKYWEVCDGDGDYECDCTDGTATAHNRCERCDNSQDDCECIYCDCCEESYAQGCERCRICEHCDRCYEHDNCECDRCGECHELVEQHRHCNHCECERCDECNALVDDCECEQEEDEDEDETEETEETDDEVPAVIEPEPEPELTPMDIKNKLNRAFIYLRDKYGRQNVESEYEVLVKAFESIDMRYEDIAA